MDPSDPQQIKVPRPLQAAWLSSGEVLITARRIHREKIVFSASEHCRRCQEDKGCDVFSKCSKAHKTCSYPQWACLRLVLPTKRHERRRGSGAHPLLLNYWLLVNSRRGRTIIFNGVQTSESSRLLLIAPDPGSHPWFVTQWFTKQTHERKKGMLEEEEEVRRRSSS